MKLGRLADSPVLSGGARGLDLVLNEALSRPTLVPTLDVVGLLSQCRWRGSTGSDASEDANGTSLFDHTAITMGIILSSIHTLKSCPTIIAGGGAGFTWS